MLAAVLVGLLVLVPLLMAIALGTSLKREDLPPNVRSLDKYRASNREGPPNG